VRLGRGAFVDAGGADLVEQSIACTQDRQMVSPLCATAHVFSSVLSGQMISYILGRHEAVACLFLAEETVSI